MIFYVFTQTTFCHRFSVLCSYLIGYKREIFSSLFYHYCFFFKSIKKQNMEIKRKKENHLVHDFSDRKRKLTQIDLPSFYKKKFLCFRFELNLSMTSYQKVQNFKCRCPLIQNGLYSNEIYALQRSKRRSSFFSNFPLEKYFIF